MNRDKVVHVDPTTHELVKKLTQVGVGASQGAVVKTLAEAEARRRGIVTIR